MTRRYRYSRRFSRKATNYASLQAKAEQAQGPIGDEGFSGFNDAENAMYKIMKAYEDIAKSGTDLSSDPQGIADDIYLAIQQAAKARDTYRKALKDADRVWKELDDLANA